MIVEQIEENKKIYNSIHFYNFVSLTGATATLNDIKFVSLALEGVDTCLFH